MNQSDRMAVESKVRVSQIIALALMGGVAAFSCVVIILESLGTAPIIANAEPPLLSYAAAAIFAIQAGLSFFVPKLVARRQADALAAAHGGDRRSMPIDDLLHVHSTKTILAYALLEGGAVFGCLAFLLEGRHWTFGIVAAAVALMLVHYPTASKVEAWIDRQRGNDF